MNEQQIKSLSNKKLKEFLMIAQREFVGRSLCENKAVIEMRHFLLPEGNIKGLNPFPNNDLDSRDSAISYWSIEREFPKEMAGIICELPYEGHPARSIVDYIMREYGGGSYIIYACNYKAEQINNRPLTIPGEPNIK